jgi:hypothetical protein
MFRLFTFEELDRLPEPAWLVKDILPENGLAMVYGEPGAYKTFLALDWALSISAGLPWHGRSVRQGDVVYVYAEGAKGLSQRIKAWRTIRQGGFEHFRALPASLDMLDKDARRQLVNLVTEARLNPSLVVFDTLARCFGDGDENAQKDMKAFVDGCDDIRRVFSGAAVLVIHHAGKNPQAKDRGSTVLRAAADTVMHVNLKSTVRLDCEKQKDAEPFQAIHMTAKTVALGDRASSCILQPATANSSLQLADHQKAAANDRKLLDALRYLGEAGATYSEWRNASGMQKSTFKDVRKRLVSTGKARKEGARYYPVQ